VIAGCYGPAMSESPYRGLPAVDAVLADERVRNLDLGAAVTTEAARSAIAEARQKITAGADAPDFDAVIAVTLTRARTLSATSLATVINGTGVVIHTNLGRAPLAPDALLHAQGACTLEYDTSTGSRGSRRDHAEHLLTGLSGAEAALVVNNNAAAVVISRSELVEIGGSFRIPDIMACSGAVLREVGTTNRTYLEDYESAIGPNTGAILRVHPSNFSVTGFVHRPKPAELAELAHAHDLPFLHDLGSGGFAAMPAAIAHDGDPVAEVAAGADVVCFSGDKLLGGPQAGIAIGSKAYIDAMAVHPLARALRVGKLTLAALEHTLAAYRRGEPGQVPVYRMLHADLDGLEARGTALASAMEPLPVDAIVARCEDAVGGGSHPDAHLQGVALGIRPEHGGVTRLAERLRQGAPPVIGTLRDDRLWIHLRTVDPEDDGRLATALETAVRGRSVDGKNRPEDQG
jgi:L-seryl-tRNA(Ser) seleniumtransferase